MSRGGLVVAVVVCLATTAGVAGVAVGDTQPDREPSLPPALQLDSDRVVIEVAVQPYGTGVWEVEYRKRLEDDNASASFAAYRQRVEERPVTVTGPFRDEMAAAADEASTATGREMAVENVTVSARRTSVPEPFGVVTFRFEWEGFAETHGDRLRAGPALSEFFLTNETTLILSWPGAYERTDVSPTPDETRNGSVAWTGPTEFAAGEPVAVLERTGGSGRPGPVYLGLVAVAGLGLMVVGGALARWITGGAESDEQSAPAEETDEADAGQPAGQATDEVPSELLSSEERVIELLETRGGRVKQQQIVEAFDWSETKTSQVVNDLQEAGTVEVYRIGRENVVALPGEIDV